jgi:hypothetical protein
MCWPSELERAAHHARLDADAIFTLWRACTGAAAAAYAIVGSDRRAAGSSRSRSRSASARSSSGVSEAMGGSRVPRRERVGRARGAWAFRCCATSRRERPSSSTRPASSHRGCAPTTRARAVHLRIRLPRAARFGDRRHVGLRVAPQHGRAARAQDPRHSRGTGHRRRDPDSGLEPARPRCSSRTRSASRIARASSRTATSDARSSCRGRRCARRACARS